MQFASFGDDENQETGNFDELINYKLDDYKDFNDICKQLCDFRIQTRGIHKTHRELSGFMETCDRDIETMKRLRSNFPTNEDWTKKVDELVELYQTVSDYYEKKKELQNVQEQMEITTKIRDEFKIQINQSGVCALCCENPIGLFLDPCGHVCCTVCWSKMDGRSTCPCCRTRVTSRKMYLI